VTVAFSPEVKVVAILFTDQLSLSCTTRLALTLVVAESFWGGWEFALAVALPEMV
jgi:hypothetical protein